MKSVSLDKEADQSYESSDFDHRISSEISSISSRSIACQCELKLTRRV